MLSIFKREVQSYFNTMTGFVFIAFMTFVVGIYFMAYNMVQGYPYFSAVLSSVWFIFLIGIPFLTMKCFAEEKKAKTDQLLLCSPLSLTEIVLGKYFAMVFIFGLACIILALCPFVIELVGEGHYLTDYCALFAFFLEGCLFIAIGMMISSCTESQVLSAVGTFIVMLLFFLWDSLIDFFPTSALGSIACFIVLILFFCWILQRLYDTMVIPFITAGISSMILIGIYIYDASLFENSFVQFLSIFSFSTFLDQVSYTYLLDLSGLIQVVSLILFFVFMTIQILNRRRWC